MKLNPEIVKGIEGEFVGHGLAFGKFMPPTNGHLYFLNFARQSCRKLTILVCSLPGEPIPGEVRYKWMREIFPDCNVVHHYLDIPQEPEGPGDIPFFELWRDSIHKHCPGERFDALFASEPYGYKMAHVMDIRFVPVDSKRDLVSISGTEMRKNPIRHWEHLHPVVRPYFLRRVAVVGAPSDGKSRLARDLAAHFDTVHVADYAAAMMDDYKANMPGFSEEKMSLSDVSTIARGQMASENSLAPQANRVIFCDSDLSSIMYDSERRFGECPLWVAKKAVQRKYDLYLVVEGGDSGLTARWKEDLTRHEKSFVVIDCPVDARLRQAAAAVDKMLSE